jgi:hypothetical protein
MSTEIEPLGLTRRSDAAAAADAQSAVAFWQSLESLDDVRRARILRERDVTGPLAAMLAEVETWNRAYSYRNRESRRAAAVPESSARDDTRRRAYVDEQTADLMPPPRLWNRNTWVGREQERHQRRLWTSRIQSPPPRLLRKLRQEGEAIEHEVARAELLSRSQLVDPLELRHRRLERLLEHRYIPGKISPAGMGYQRALQIAVACLEREDRIAGVRPVERRLAGTDVRPSALAH